MKFKTTMVQCIVFIAVRYSKGQVTTKDRIDLPTPFYE